MPPHAQGPHRPRALQLRLLKGNLARFERERGSVRSAIGPHGTHGRGAGFRDVPRLVCPFRRSHVGALLDQ